MLQNDPARKRTSHFKLALGFMMRKLISISIAAASLIYGSATFSNERSELYFRDAHSQVDQNIGIGLVLKRMEENGVTTTLLSSRHKGQWRDIQEWSTEYPTQIRPLLRSKSKHYMNNTKKDYKKSKKQLNNGEFVGAAEILAFHAQKGNKAPEVAVDLTDARIILLIDESISRGWPVIIHIEFASIYGDKRQSYMSALKALLEQHPKHPFVIIHMGQLRHAEVATMIVQHQNVFFLTSHADPITTSSSKQPWVNMFTLFGTHLKDSWKETLVKYPERFIFALDNVWADHWSTTYTNKITLWRKALSELPEEVASLIAHGNAERLWRLK